MADEAKRTGGEPDFDTDRAWKRFERLAAAEPVPAFWTRDGEQANPDATRQGTSRPEGHNRPMKDGADKMKRNDEFTAIREAAIAGATDNAGAARAAWTTGKAGAARAGGTDGAWRTEKPARRRLRRLTAGAAAAVMAFGLFATPLGDRVLAAMQMTFRIQNMVGIGITADDMATISYLLEHGSPEGDRSFSLAQYGQLTQSGSGEARTVTWSEAEERMGGSLLKPDDASDPVFQPATRLTFNLNVKAVNRLLARLGSDTSLPDEADGKAISLYIPDGIATRGSLDGHPVRLLQFGKPELTVEDGIDASIVREAVLGLPVLPDSLRGKLAAIGDWQSTLPVPVPDGVTTNFSLGGYDAILTLEGTDRYIFWLNGDRIGWLSGTTSDFPTEAAFRSAAEELVRP